MAFCCRLSVRRGTGRFPGIRTELAPGSRGAVKINTVSYIGNNLWSFEGPCRFRHTGRACRGRAGMYPVPEFGVPVMDLVLPVGMPVYRPVQCAGRLAGACNNLLTPL